MPLNTPPAPESNNRRSSVATRITLISALAVAAIGGLIVASKRNDPDGIVPVVKDIKEGVDATLEVNRKIADPREARDLYRQYLKARYMGGKTKALTAAELEKFLDTNADKYEEKYHNRLNQNAPGATKLQILEEVQQEIHPEID